MCLIAFAINASARWPLVVAANRDEFLDRPTLPLARWRTGSGQNVISGRDLRAGGTWLGITPGGRMAFLTNVREAKPQVAASSRGELVTRWLEDDGDAASFVAALRADHCAYAGFNLVLGDFQRNAWTWVTNKSAIEGGWHSQPLASGVYGLSNAQLDTPWPKTLELKRVLQAALLTGANPLNPEQLKTQLWTALANPERAPATQLPATGVVPELEQALSSAFVEFPEHGYGTRNSTLLLAGAQEAQGGQQWDIQMEERTFRRLKGAHSQESPATTASNLTSPSVERCRVTWQQV